jgi:hypothetical protein
MENGNKTDFISIEWADSSADVTDRLCLYLPRQQRWLLIFDGNRYKYLGKGSQRHVVESTCSTYKYYSFFRNYSCLRLYIKGLPFVILGRW